MPVRGHLFADVSGKLAGARWLASVISLTGQRPGLHIFTQRVLGPMGISAEAAPVSVV
jgi:hypothetical protein